MADQTFARYVNERRILTQLRQHASLSRADLARRLTLTPATITNLVENLRADGLVIELNAREATDGRRGLGRPGVDLALNHEGGFFLGVEIGVGVARFALLDLTLRLADTKTVLLESSMGPEDVIEMIAGHIGALERKRAYRGRLRAVCMTVPGLVRSDGYVVHLPILGWKGVNLLDLARARLVKGYDLLVENNANAAAFGEVYTQPALNADCIVYLKPGMGCGGAVVVNGRLLRGAAGTAAELGHVRVANDGPTCSCGRQGCLETRVNLPALARAYDSRRTWGRAELRDLPGRIVALAGEGDRLAAEAAGEVIRHLGTGLVTLVNTFNPSTVLLGGSMRPVVEQGIASLRDAVRVGIVPGMTVPEFCLSTLGDFECAAGVAAIAHHQSFDVSNIEIGLNARTD